MTLARLVPLLCLMFLCSCARSYEGRYEATFSADVTLTTPPATETLTGPETIEFLEGSLENNEVLLSRSFDADCIISGTKRGGFGLRFLGGEACPRDGRVFVLVDGSAANARTDALTIDLTWTVNDDENEALGTASEAVVVDMTERLE